MFGVRSLFVEFQQHTHCLRANSVQVDLLEEDYAA